MSLLERVRNALKHIFHVERVLGSGGMGVVFEAFDPRLKQKRAVKVLRPEAATATTVKRFQDEPRWMAKLQHPNIVQVRQAGGPDDGLYWFAMDLIQGETLAKRLERGPLGQKETMSLARELLSALELAHQNGIVHRDIKPSNIFLVDGRALLTDFGIARAVTTTSADEELTRPGQEPGTPRYMAPELRTGASAVAATDLYSLGLVLYECFTGRPWDLASGDWRKVPSRCVPVLRRAFAANPVERWPDANAMASAFGARPRWPWIAGAATVAISALAVWISRPERPACADAGDPYEPGAMSGAACEGWQRAEQLFLSGSWKAADSAYRSVLLRDTSCLPCEFQLREVGHWLERRPDSAREARLRAGLPRFSEPWRHLVEARLAPAGRRIELLKDLTDSYRDWRLAWYYLGTELFNRGSLFGTSRSDANNALDQLEVLSPQFVPGWTDRTLARIAAGDSVGADSALKKLGTLPRADGLAEAQRLLAKLAFAFRFTPDGLAVWAMADPAGLSGIPEIAAGPRVLPGLGTPLGGVELGRAFERDGPKPLQRSGLLAQMLGNVALGRIDSARGAGRRLNQAFSSQKFVAFAAMLDAAVVIFDDAGSASDAAQVEKSLEVFIRPMMAPPVRRDAAWLIALAALRRRDPEAARATLTLLDGEPAPGYRRAFITAAVLAYTGQPDSALAATDFIVNDLETWDRVERSPLLRAAIRLSRARWYEMTGIPESARSEYRWYQHFHLPDYPVDDPLPSDGDWAFSTLASWRQARLLDHDARDSDVCDSYRLVAERWADGESLYRTRADTARGRITALGCE